MPDRFQVMRKRIAWAANRFVSNSAPSSQPPGNGMAPATFSSELRPKKTCPNLTNTWKGIQTTNHERKYLLMTVRFPDSAWARVPAKTKKSDSANRMTVSRSEANGSRSRFFIHGTAGLGVACGRSSGGCGLAVGWVVIA